MNLFLYHFNAVRSEGAKPQESHTQKRIVFRHERFKCDNSTKRFPPTSARRRLGERVRVGGGGEAMHTTKNTDKEMISFRFITPFKFTRFVTAPTYSPRRGHKFISCLAPMSQLRSPALLWGSFHRKKCEITFSGLRHFPARFFSRAPGFHARSSPGLRIGSGVLIAESWRSVANWQRRLPLQNGRSVVGMIDEFDLVANLEIKVPSYIK